MVACWSGPVIDDTVGANTADCPPEGIETDAGTTTFALFEASATVATEFAALSSDTVQLSDDPPATVLGVHETDATWAERLIASATAMDDEPSVADTVAVWSAPVIGWTLPATVADRAPAGTLAAEGNDRFGLFDVIATVVLPEVFVLSNVTVHDGDRPAMTVVGLHVKLAMDGCEANTPTIPPVPLAASAVASKAAATVPVTCIGI
jgi:hypothetical protein